MCVSVFFFSISGKAGLSVTSSLSFSVLFLPPFQRTVLPDVAFRQLFAFIDLSRSASAFRAPRFLMKSSLVISLRIPRM